MVRISNTTQSNILPTETQTSKSDPLGPEIPSKFGVGGIKDSFEQPKASSIREIIQAATSEGKAPMTQNNLNRFIQNNLKPNQYVDAFRDLKGWVTKNFYLTPKQTAEINTLTKQDTQRVQQTAAKAAELNKAISIQFLNPEPLSSQAKKLEFVGILTDDLKDSGLQQNIGELEAHIPEVVADAGKQIGVRLTNEVGNPYDQLPPKALEPKNIIQD